MSKAVTVAELIGHLSKIADQSAPVAFSCDNCGVWSQDLHVSTAPERLWYHAADDYCPNDENIDASDGCKCGPKRIVVGNW